MSVPNVIQKAFDLDERIIAVAWDKIEPVLILSKPWLESAEEEMVQEEFLRQSETYLLFDELWRFFEDCESTRYDRE